MSRGKMTRVNGCKGITLNMTQLNTYGELSSKNSSTINPKLARSVTSNKPQLNKQNIKNTLDNRVAKSVDMGTEALLAGYYFA
jgi:hypothetical protein